MRERKRSLTFFLMALFIIGSLPITNSVSAEDEVDNWPENDAWLHIELISWSANETVEWDNNGGLPDPIFKICIEADGGNLDCINTPTWENQMTLNNSWNYSLDIPDHSNILNITIECEDNDALNDDECDMNSELDEWKLYAEYNWSATPTLTVSGSGDGDGNDTWKNAASTWKFTIDGFGDEDGDGVSDNLDTCENTYSDVTLLNQTLFPGCSWDQIDIDGDGVISRLDSDPFDFRIQQVIGGGRVFELDCSINNTNSGCGTIVTTCNSDDYHVLTYKLQAPFCEIGSYDATNYEYAVVDYDGGGINLQSFQEPADYRHSDFPIGNCEYDGSLWTYFAVGQVVETGSALIHCVTSNQNTQDCSSSIFSLNTGTEIQSFDWDYSSFCNHNAPRQNKLSMIGTFGDFDANGIIDFANTNGYYYGISENPIQFLHIGRNTGIMPVTSADIDNDGFDDLIGHNGILFMSDDGVEFELTWRTHGGNILMTQVTDTDEDGDLDVIVYTKPTGCGDCNMNIEVFTNSWIPDEDGDGVADGEDICPTTVDVTDIDSQGCSESQRDTDGDSITDDIDLCSSTLSSWTVDGNGCAAEQLDDDNDQINNALDQCPETPEGDLVNVRGCSFEDSQDLDSDNDGVLDSEDACPETEQGVTVDSLGCDVGGGQTMDADSDGDGVYDLLDECSNTPAEATADFKGCPMDSDFDGVYDGIDECPSSNNPSPSDMDKSSEVDSTGCFIDAAGSENDSGSAAFGCLGMIIMIGVVVFVVRKSRSPKQEQVFYAQTQSVGSPVQQQFVSTPQISSRERELEHQSRQAQIEAQRLRQELANQAYFTQQLQSEVAQKQMSDAALAQKQHELATAQQEKEELEAKLAEAEKNTPIVQNITYNIQDSAISGDITNKITRNDLE
jgi:hypothetical protein